MKVDGATKELAFFSSRVGFLSHPHTGAAAEALQSKLKCLIRGTVGSASGPAMAMGIAAPEERFIFLLACLFCLALVLQVRSEAALQEPAVELNRVQS